ncbi:diaminopimelate epimerase [Xiamenia xianingshaonis]|uniref:diaminopimelate epimerase n=1 Tax=Xiamenia xianingshaonis TaxID=2682776 RepID=UPI00140B98C8|nr:diaminopimelate epimerase [Xiamenia xianingshaonis]
MELEFVKLHGLGNDFVFANDLDESIDLTKDQVAWLCDRHFGIGGDGVILVRPAKAEGCDAYMHYINSDGTLAQMCGNGVRCFAKYLVDEGIVEATGHLVAETLAGPRSIDYAVDENGKLVEATVMMGEPILTPASVPTNLPATATTGFGVDFVKDCAVDSPWGPFAFTCVSMGNPHAVTFIEDFSTLPDELFDNPAGKRLETLALDKIGAFFESHAAFPEKTNVEFAVVGPDAIAMRVFERGCGETLACGTGACATSVAACLTGRAGCENDVALRGGVLHIRWDDDAKVYMTGTAAEAFRGTVAVPDQPRR